MDDRRQLSVATRCVGEDEAGRAGLVADAQIALLDIEPLAHRCQCAFGAEVRAAGVPVEDGCRVAGRGVGDGDFTFVDVEPDVVFWRGGSGCFFFHH